MNAPIQHRRRSGFSLMELMFVVAIVTVISGGVLACFVEARKLWYPSALTMSANIRGGDAVSRMVYGINQASMGLRAASRASVWSWSDGDSWLISYNTNRWVMYNGYSDTLSSSMHGLLCRGVIRSTATVTSASCDLTLFVSEGSGRTAVTNRYQTMVMFRN